MNANEKIAQQIAALKAMKGKKVEAGWFETQRYPSDGSGKDGRLFSEVAKLNEFGGTIEHPGGTKYKRVEGQKSRFLSNSSTEAADGVTGPHTIVIPARPFMRLAGKKFKENLSATQAKIAKKMIDGKIKPEQALGEIGLVMENCIIDSIKDGGWEPNAKSTVAKKGFDSPLTDSGKLAGSVVSKVS